MATREGISMISARAREKDLLGGYVNRAIRQRRCGYAGSRLLQVLMKNSDMAGGTTKSTKLQISSAAPGFVLPEAGLLIRAPFVDWILDGLKAWEMRTKRTTRRGRIGLIRSKSGLVVGEANLVDVVGPLTHRQLIQNAEKMNQERWDVAAPEVPTFAWVLDGASRYAPPVPYTHRSGAVIWARLP